MPLLRRYAGVAAMIGAPKEEVAAVELTAAAAAEEAGAAREALWRFNWSASCARRPQEAGRSRGGRRRGSVIAVSVRRSRRREGSRADAASAREDDRAGGVVEARAEAADTTKTTRAGGGFGKTWRRRSAS